MLPHLPTGSAQRHCIDAPLADWVLHAMGDGCGGDGLAGLVEGELLGWLGQGLRMP